MASPNATCDEIDKQILEILQEDAKSTIKEIADKTNKSATAIRARIQRLEKDLIKKYVAIIDCRKLGYREMVLASLRLNTAIPLELVKKEIESMEKIKYAYQVTGEYPLFIMAKCLNHLDSMGLIDTLRKLPGVEEVKTEIVMDPIKEDHSIIIPEEKKCDKCNSTDILETREGYICGTCGHSLELKQ
jgi:DNA-binding Lrp family transcriptional regulator